MKERIIIFLWGFGGFMTVAICTYLMDIADIREIDYWKLATLIVTVASGYIVNQITKSLNK